MPRTSQLPKLSYLKAVSKLFPAVAALAIPGVAAKIGGELKQWHRVILDCEGPMSGEAATPNPFLDYRLQVEFTGPAGQKYSVPGFYAADGNVEETGASEGKVWRAYFSPDAVGKWTYSVSFRTGPKAALSGAGIPVAGEDGATGEFQVGPTDKSGRDHRGKGMLRYVEKHHYQFAGSREYFLKVGSDSPENLLGYADFDGTSKGGGALKTYAPHIGDWKEGDPVWKGGKGKGLIGALNYLAGKGMNAFSFLTLNATGDGKDVWMWTGPNAFQNFDCSKLAQWEIVFSHADKLGLFLHFKTQETEVDQVLDGGDLGDNRKLYYRELIARFGHHLALNWNLGEENSQTIQQVKDLITYIHDTDPYDHPIVIHTFPGEHAKYYDALKGNASFLTGPSIQTGWDNVYAASRKWREASAAASRKWVVCNDEQGGANVGVTADASYAGNKGGGGDNREGIRQQTLWGNFMAGGGGVEYYFGYGTGETDLTLNDFRSRDVKWDDARHVHEFFVKNNIPFWDMDPSDAASTGWALAKPGEHYVVYLPKGGSPTLNLTAAAGTYVVKRFDPRTGKFEPETKVQGGSQAALGASPTAGDWAVWVKNEAVSSIGNRRVLALGERRAETGGSRAFRIDGRWLAPEGIRKWLP